ncbi:hypothetical protein C4577_01785 [Candidatus Parcubacteria bacterium]|nr:MAG: hypothetical protein C4577_01785 [Candidatus Parcubacteria bacterium]
MKLESPFLKTALLVLGEGEYENKLSYARFEELKTIIATCSKMFYVLGKSGKSIDDCKEFLADFEEGDSVEEMLNTLLKEGEE